MLKKLIYKLLQKRHFWRYASFDEIAELYTSRMLRILALNMAAMFVVVYLYQLGYNLIFISWYLIVYMSVKVLITFPVGWFVARFGAKHSMFVGNIVYAPAILLITQLPNFGPGILVITVLLQTFAAVVYDIGYNVDFSKVRDINHTGKELGFMNIFEKIATGLSPLIGGFIAFIFGPEAVMVVAFILFALAALPLFHTGEPIKSGRKISFKSFPWRVSWRSLRANIGIGYDDLTSSSVWSLFIMIVILASTTNEVYAQLGSFASITLISALVISYVYGKLIDREKGRELLRYMAIANSLVHLTRPLISSPVGVISTNVANEVATTGYKMAYTKGMFDLADLTGNRIAYITLLQLTHNIGSALAGAVLLLCILMLGESDGLKVFFISSAVAVLLVLTAKFPLYRR